MHQKMHKLDDVVKLEAADISFSLSEVYQLYLDGYPYCVIFVSKQQEASA